MTRVRARLLAAAVLWFAALAAATALSVLAAREPTLPGDVASTRRIQGWPVPDPLADVVRAVTMTEVVVGIGVAVSVALWMAGARREGMALLVATVLLPLLQTGVKELVDRPRPSPDLVELRARFSSPSFPAGHVMSPTLVYGYLAWLAAKARRLWARWLVVTPCAAVLALTGLVNVYLGVHWPSDVVGGYLWGLVLLAPAAIGATEDGRVTGPGQARRRTS